MSDLQVFSFEGSQVRTVVRDDGPWWVLADVCDALGIVNSRNTASRLDEDEKGACSLDTPGGPQTMTIVNEPGLYSTILTTRGRSARVQRFKRWLTHEVIPAIRKTGSYSVPAVRERATAPDLHNPATLRSLLLDYADRTEQFEQQVQELKPV